MPQLKIKKNKSHLPKNLLLSYWMVLIMILLVPIRLDFIKLWRNSSKLSKQVKVQLIISNTNFHNLNLSPQISQNNKDAHKVLKLRMNLRIIGLVNQMVKKMKRFALMVLKLESVGSKYLMSPLKLLHHFAKKLSKLNKRGFNKYNHNLVLEDWWKSLKNLIKLKTLKTLKK